ncbi:hypothetical protein K1719_015800 [Acacia pycnantha]|nr:hypothetical protein K1719_015800 [Acacia pycnantha]
MVPADSKADLMDLNLLDKGMDHDKEIMKSSVDFNLLDQPGLQFQPRNDMLRFISHWELYSHWTHLSSTPQLWPGLLFPKVKKGWNSI